jgi:hypothetical protein
MEVKMNKDLLDEPYDPVDKVIKLLNEMKRLDELKAMELKFK